MTPPWEKAYWEELYDFCDPALPENGSGHADFCEKCGAATKRELNPYGGFDRHNGWPDVRYRTVCPRRRHWWDGHHRSIWLFAMRKAVTR